MKLDEIKEQGLPLTRTVGLETDPVEPDRKREPVQNYYLLAIAVDEYKDGLPLLNNPVRDTDNLVKVLTDIYRFKAARPEEDAARTDLRTADDRYKDFKEPIWVYNDSDHRRTSLYNGAATWQAIVAKIKAIRKVIGEDDALLIYFAGHGLYTKENGQYYLMCSDSQKANEQSWLNIKTIFEYFDNYKDNKICRDLLLVIDACYSGSAMTGNSQQQTIDFSRHMLSSAMNDQLAGDGLPERGSAFANAFTYYLKNVGDDYPNIMRDPRALIDRFDMEQRLQRVPGPEQELFFGRLPTDTGTGFFEFEKFDKDKPQPFTLKESLVNHLDFQAHRATLEEIYKDTKNELNIITSHGYSEDLHRLANKITFRWMKNRARLDFDLDYCQVFEPVKIRSVADDLWQVLYRQLKSSSTDDGLLEDQQSIHDHLFKLLKADKKEYEGKTHVIITFYFTIGGNETMALIDRFCVEFSKLFMAELANYPAEEKTKLGRMFILFSDERQGATGFSSSDFASFSGTPPFNFIQISPFRGINENHVITWKNEFARTAQSRKILALDDWAILSAMMGVPGCKEFTCGYEAFVEKLTDYCGYNELERTILVKQLFDFQTSLI
ncbi:MAG: caspase family protein [Chitinophagaceae bacterium]|nr:MAG: caspase family protein [Chitinophagaceae bacterium]